MTVGYSVWYMCMVLSTVVRSGRSTGGASPECRILRTILSYRMPVVRYAPYTYTLPYYNLHPTLPSCRTTICLLPYLPLSALRPTVLVVAPLPDVSLGGRSGCGWEERVRTPIGNFQNYNFPSPRVTLLQRQRLVVRCGTVSKTEEEGRMTNDPKTEETSRPTTGSAAEAPTSTPSMTYVNLYVTDATCARIDLLAEREWHVSGAEAFRRVLGAGLAALDREARAREEARAKNDGLMADAAGRVQRARELGAEAYADIASRVEAHQQRLDYHSKEIAVLTYGAIAHSARLDDIDARLRTAEAYTLNFSKWVAKVWSAFEDGLKMGGQS